MPSDHSADTPFEMYRIKNFPELSELCGNGIKIFDQVSDCSKRRRQSFPLQTLWVHIVPEEAAMCLGEASGH